MREFDDTFRLEPVARSNEVASGLAAKIHDALWLLTRQWQFGEFAGQDAGSPTDVSVRARSRPITGWRPAGQGQWVAFDPRSAPLEPLVEAERSTSPGLRDRVESGAQFLRLLREAGRGDLAPAVLAAHGFDAGDRDEITRLEAAAGAEATPSLAGLLVARVPDGAKLLAAHAAGGVRVAGQPDDALAAVTAEWASQWQDRPPPEGSADTFDRHRFEHHFDLRATAAGAATLVEESFAPGPKIVLRGVDERAVLVADEYLGNGLDWFQFDVTADVEDPVDTTGDDPPPVLGVASPIRYGGMPADRFWEMEDARVDLGAADVSALDTGRVLLVEFATVYGNDWFLVPVEVPTGSLTLLDDLIVTDVFGGKHLVTRAGRHDPSWNLFALHAEQPHAAAAGLLMPPAGPAVTGEPSEQVVLARDELANLAWAIEGKTTDRRGESLDRRSRWLQTRPVPVEPDPGLPAYAVQTLVPDYWLPLVPAAVAPGAIRFELVRLQQPGVDSEPRGRLLNPDGSGIGPDDWVHEEEVPREGATVTRRPVLSRWFDGSWHAWTRREKATGTGESSSGLAFDIVRPSEPWP